MRLIATYQPTWPSVLFHIVFGILPGLPTGETEKFQYKMYGQNVLGAESNAGIFPLSRRWQYFCYFPLWNCLLLFPLFHFPPRFDPESFDFEAIRAGLDKSSFIAV